MKFIAYTDIINRALKLADKLLQNSKLVADNDIIKLEATKDKVMITARDTQNFSQITINEAEIENEGVCFINPKNLLLILKTFSHDLKIELDLVKNFLIIRAAKGVYYNNTVDYSIEYEEKRGEWVKLASLDYSAIHRFSHRLTHALSFVSKEEFKPALNCVNFKFNDNSICIQATDAIIAYSNIFENETYLDANFLLDRASCNILSEIKDTADFYLLKVHENNRNEYSEFKVVTRDIEFRAEIINERFPPLDDILVQVDTGSYNNLRITQSDFASVLKITSIASNNITKLITMNVLAKELEMVGEDEESGMFSHNSAPAEFDGDDKKLGFNYDKMVEVLNVFKDEDLLVRLAPESSKPIFITKENDPIKCLIMPVRI